MSTKDDIVKAIRRNGGEVSYAFPDFMPLLEILGFKRGQQNEVFGSLNDLRKAGVITRKTVPVNPPETYDAGSNPHANVRRRVFTLV